MKKQLVLFTRGPAHEFVHGWSLSAWLVIIADGPVQLREGPWDVGRPWEVGYGSTLFIRGQLLH